MIEVHDGTKPGDARRWVLAGDGVIGEVNCTQRQAMAMAAGPDLLAALKDAVEFISGHNECLVPSTFSGDVEWIDHCVSLHQSCQESIDKAEGKVP
jgi:hypothetical protein